MSLKSPRTADAICYFVIFSNVNDQVIGEFNTLDLSELQDKEDLLDNSLFQFLTFGSLDLLENINKDGSMWSGNVGGSNGSSAGGGSTMNSSSNNDSNTSHYIGIINSWRKWPIYAGIGYGGERMLLLREPLTKSAKRTSESIKKIMQGCNDLLNVKSLNPFNNAFTTTFAKEQLEEELRMIVNKDFI